MRMPDSLPNCPSRLYPDCLLSVYGAYETAAIVAGQAAGLSESVNFLRLEDYQNLIGGIALDLLRSTVEAVDGVPCAQACPIAVGIRALSPRGPGETS